MGIQYRFNLLISFQQRPPVDNIIRYWITGIRRELCKIDIPSDVKLVVLQLYL